MTRHTLISSLVAASCFAAITGCAPETVESETEALGIHEQAELGYNPGAGWNLVWQDEFNGTAVNGNNWTVLTSNWDPVTNNCNFGTGELEFPRAQNVTVGGGKLVITAERTGDNPVDSRCTGYGPRSFYS
ncbi:glycosyl hydrolase, partial [Archangium sp. Cb G35]